MRLANRADTQVCPYDPTLSGGYLRRGGPVCPPSFLGRIHNMFVWHQNLTAQVETFGEIKGYTDETYRNIPPVSERLSHKIREIR